MTDDVRGVRHDDDVLHEHVVRRARLTSAFVHGRRRSWAQQRRVTASVVGGVLIAASVAFTCGVTVVVRDQLAVTRAQQREQELRDAELDRQRAEQHSDQQPTSTPRVSPGAEPASPLP